MLLRLSLMVTMIFVLLADVSGSTVEGELKVWHKVTVTFGGPETSEKATPNPFTDYRLDVTFTGPSGQRYTVPGYYAADGNAADTGADAGNKWRVHLAPDEAGEWTYRVSFRTGTHVAVSDDRGAGEPVGGLDGETGTMTIKPSDKTGRDFRGKGRLNYVGGHYLQFADSKEYFLKQGADAPENLLAYADFDGDFKTDGHKDDLVKTWDAHVKDWKTGDPTWQNGKGKGLIGAINYLHSEGMNAFSFLTMNIAGDDRNVFPYTTYDERLRMDVSRLDQWEIVFEHGGHLGMFLHFKTQETENDQLLDGGDLGIERTLYYRELIARFGHHLALNWNLGEENTNTTAQIKAFCQFFKDNDPYNHPVVIHTFPGQYDKVQTPLLGNKSELTGLSIQTNFSDFRQVHDIVKTWVKKSADAGKPWIVACDEPGDAEHALVPDKDDLTHDNARMNALWGTLMAGGWGCEWYFGYGHDHSDLTCQDWRSRDLFWDQCRYALEFFDKQNIPFREMTNANSLLSGVVGYCLNKQGEVYVVFLKSAGDAKLTLPKGDYSICWYNPRTGGDLQTGTVKTLTGGGVVPLGNPPVDADKDWVVLVKKTERLACNWQGSGADSEGNEFTFAARVIDLGGDQ